MSPHEEQLNKLVRQLVANGSLSAKTLNVKSMDAPVATQNVWKNIQQVLNNHATNNNFSQIINGLLASDTYLANKTTLDAIKTQFNTDITNKGITVGTSRIIVTLADGTVYYDSKTPPSNTYANATAKPNLINENHNSRVAIMTAQTFQSGIGFESKYSTSTGKREIYVAKRIGVHGASDGTIRYSVEISA